MPILKADNRHDQAIADVLNDQNDYLRSREALEEGIGVRTAAHIRQWREAGMETWLYQNGSSVDGVCVYQIQQMIGPDSREIEPWMNIHHLAVRQSKFSTREQKERTMFLAARLAIPEAVVEKKAVGITAQFDKRWQDLIDFMNSWPGIVWEETEAYVRFWIRSTPDARVFEQRATAIGAERTR